MAKYGTYSTFDTPTGKDEKAFGFLSTEFGKIGGNVRRLSNPHDFGNYPSFEIDYPYALEFVDDDLDCLCGVCGDCEDVIEKGKWEDKAKLIESAYSDKFEKYL